LKNGQGETSARFLCDGLCYALNPTARALKGKDGIKVIAHTHLGFWHDPNAAQELRTV
jgi:hypothetical protein